MATIILKTKQIASIPNEMADEYSRSENESAGSEIGSSIETTVSVDFFTKFNIHGGWKSLLLFQFQSQFSFTIMLLVVISYSIVLRDAAYALGVHRLRWIEKSYDTTSIHLLYAFDLIYFIDLVSMTIYKNVDWTDVKYRHKPRNSFLIFIEFLTLIPLDGIYYTLTDPNMQVLYTLRLRYALRIFRLMGFYKRGKNYVGAKAHLLQLFIIVFYVIMFVITASAVTYVYSCKNLIRCVFNNEEYFTGIFYTCLSKVVMLGQTSDKEVRELRLTGLMFYLSMLAYVCNVHLISHFVCDVIQLTYEKYALIIHHQRLKVCIIRMIGSNISYNMNKCLRAISSLYNLFWMQKKGIRKEDIVCSYLPEIKYRELELDLAWDTLKHSHIFRSQSTNYLRYISKYISHMFFTPGEIIYKKNERKTKMIYIVSGVVQILSEDDNETPIISFSEGTCLGETAILIDYPSTSSVVCKGFCEVSVLEKKHYIKTSKLYPQQSRTALKQILKRYEHARKYKSLAALQKKEMSYESDELNMQWLKCVLRKLLGIKMLKNDKAFMNRIENVISCYKYLDMLVIAKELELVTDSIFLKTTFPFIFQPHSIVLTAWHRFIFLAFIYFSLLYPYNLSTADSVSINYLVTHIVISILWYMDLYVEISTAVKTREHFYTTVQDIFMYRFTTTNFILNFLSALNPGFLLYLMVPTINLREFLLFEMNKMLKIYIVEVFFDNLTFSSTSRLLWLNYCKLLIYLFYLMYYISAFFHMMACFDGKCNFQYKMYLERHNFSTPVEILVFGGYSSIKSLCNFQRHKFNRYFNLYGLFLILAAMYLFSVLSLAHTSACEAITHYDIQSVNEYMRRFQVAMHVFGLNNLYKRIAGNITKMYQLDGVTFIYSNEVYKYLPRDLFKIVRNTTFSEFMESLPIFASCDKKAIDDIASRVANTIYQQNELIVLQGESCTHMHIIIQGYCISYFGDKKTVLGPGNNLSGFELCMNLPILRTIYTLTNCQIMSLRVEDFKQILLTYPSFYYLIKESTKDIRALEEFTQLINWETFRLTTSTLQTERLKHFIFFGHAKRTEYVKGFRRWSYLLRYIMIPCTFTPYGNIIIYWEISRSFLALLNVILLPLEMIAGNNSYWHIVFMVLDCMAWIDIILRFHIIYFNKTGIEIIHPFKTAEHYLTHGFLLDLVSVFPIEIVGKRLFQSSTLEKYYKLNRMLQIRRLFGLLDYFSLFNVNMLKVVDLIKYVCAATIIINVSAFLILNRYCKFVISDEVGKFQCGERTWLKYIRDKTKNTDASADHTYIYSVFLVTSLFANVYFPFILTKPKDEKYMLMIVSITGYAFWIYVSANIIARNLTKNFDLITYQDAMRALVKFMNYRRIDKRLKSEVIMHFEYIWKKTGIVKIHDVISVFSVPFRKSILFEVFGFKVMKSKIFSIAGEAVIRNLLLHTKHEIILKTGIIYSVNDVHGNIILLYKGKVEVLGADQSHLAFLTEGSIFGNLDNFPKTRQTLTMIASGHVELLIIDTMQFHNILSKHPEIYRIFMKRISLNVDYVENYIDLLKISTETKKTKKTKKRTAAR